METSEFSDVQQSFPEAELLPVGGSTCDCYRVKLYGKLHFMKRLKPEFRTDPRYVAALQKEFETGFRLDHPHLVLYVSKGDDYLLTEYVDGMTLRTFVAKNPDYFKSVQNTYRFLNQLLDVVGYLHQHQVVHLDLKPSNILITRIGQEVKLADLGFCYTDTYTDTMGRTDKYAAPEQLAGVSKVDVTTDIYAIGKILDTLPLPSIYNKVKERCLKELPAERFQSTEEIKACLPSERKRWPWLVLVILGLMVLIGLWLNQKPQSEAVPEEPSAVIEDTIEETLPHDTINPAILEENSKPSTSVEGQGAISNKNTDNHNNQLMADIQKEVEKNLAETLDPYGDSIRRSRSSIYSAVVYLRQLNMTSTKNLSVKYPHISKDYIFSQIDSLSMILIKELSNNEEE
jgi:serine/threonine protein kinase